MIAEIVLGLAFAGALVCMYGLGRMHEALWWIRLMRDLNGARQHLIKEKKVSPEWWAGNIAAEELVMSELDEREKTFMGRWFGW